MVYAAPGALFPLMAFFLLIRPGESTAFVPLYITGKVISAATIAGWALFAFIRLGGFPPFMLLFFFLGAADLTTIAGTALLNLRGSAPKAGFCQTAVATGDGVGTNGGSTGDSAVAEQPVQETGGEGEK
jgi:hypothetical protein